MLCLQVETHKTNEAFGVAQLLLNAEEYGWMEAYLEVRPRMMGGIVSPYFFSTSTANPCKNLNEYLQEAWTTMKLPGKPNFTDFRSSIATYVSMVLMKLLLSSALWHDLTLTLVFLSQARAALGEDDRKKVARFMCHDLSTAAKFYALNLTPREAQDQRKIFERVVHAAGTEVAAEEAEEPSQATVQFPKKRKRKQAPTQKRQRKEDSDEETSEEEGQVPYQESGTSAEEVRRTPELKCSELLIKTRFASLTFIFSFFSFSEHGGGRRRRRGDPLQEAAAKKPY